ncbi:hypothetical protein CDD80_2806 [Ophiocordyceps camponoti-rufipedis]|uniref:Uncharacterized protein n=1 Tax=Ophiocordyceps camponoti-rufipedis TaxID=2004952 RepID=A0A2C5YPU6_9HYPO|nr:hypothetical protein CDD80_2806 [Ophiocordyceps camponoti-rufipedis]
MCRGLSILWKTAQILRQTSASGSTSQVERRFARMSLTLSTQRPGLQLVSRLHVSHEHTFDYMRKAIRVQGQTLLQDDGGLDEDLEVVSPNEGRFLLLLDERGKRPTTQQSGFDSVEGASPRGIGIGSELVAVPMMRDPAQRRLAGQLKQDACAVTRSGNTEREDPNKSKGFEKVHGTSLAFAGCDGNQTTMNQVGEP